MYCSSFLSINISWWWAFQVYTILRYIFIFLVKGFRYLFLCVKGPLIFLFNYTTVCPRSSYPYCVVSYCKKWVTTFWTYSNWVWNRSFPSNARLRCGGPLEPFLPFYAVQGLATATTTFTWSYMKSENTVNKAQS